MQRIITAAAGLMVGIINALFGAGGGTIVVPFIKSKGKSQKEAQASAIAIILPLSIISVSVYLRNGYFDIKDGLFFLPFSVLGGFAGSLIMKKISDKILRKVFSLLMLYLGIRMILK